MHGEGHQFVRFESVRLAATMRKADRHKTAAPPNSTIAVSGCMERTELSMRPPFRNKPSLVSAMPDGSNATCGKLNEMKDSAGSNGPGSCRQAGHAKTLSSVVVTLGGVFRIRWWCPGRLNSWGMSLNSSGNPTQPLKVRHGPANTAALNSWSAMDCRAFMGANNSKRDRERRGELLRASASAPGPSRSDGRGATGLFGVQVKKCTTDQPRLANARSGRSAYGASLPVRCLKEYLSRRHTETQLRA